MTTAQLLGTLRVPAHGFRGLAGVARRDVTPPVGIRNRMWGAATSDVSVGVHRPLLLEAIAFATDDRAQPVVLLCLDTCTWGRHDDFSQFRGTVLAATGLSPERLLANVSHTHAGCTEIRSQADLPGGELIPAYLDSLYEHAVSAIKEAVGSLVPATLEWVVGRSDIAVNRDLDLNGRALVGFNPLESADDTVLVGRVSRSDGTALATIVNYACHGTTLGPGNLELSPDYVGALRETVEEATGAPCLFFQGASGDTSPREQYSPDTALADRHGKAIGHAVVAALMTMPPPGTELAFDHAIESGAPLGVWSPKLAELSTDLQCSVVTAELPLRKMQTLEELKQQWSDIPPQSLDERLRRFRRIFSDMGPAYADPANRPDSVAHQVWVVKLGTSYIVAQPGEAYNVFQTELRRRAGETPVAVLNLTNGPSPGYLASADAYCRNAYQSWHTVLAQGALEKLTDVASEALQALAEVAQ
ncbi:hypothetical protein [Streptomyces rhizosphaericus]|uniref:Neutral/alkaline non-lysosomal ceramidase N-terminal domain-containing protein n=1 Tax=Streptomyces rhizosphaericus TaxID=114699 RepID=A0A6G4AVH6_9ACTN|nr:hypothetical protein [Streptomyces rhizosphaericus]NEW77375.1 hypothetical protein [Streptomyces rhizosphaericus]